MSCASRRSLFPPGATLWDPREISPWQLTKLIQEALCATIKGAAFSLRTGTQWNRIYRHLRYNQRRRPRRDTRGIDLLSNQCKP